MRRANAESSPVRAESSGVRFKVVEQLSLPGIGVRGEKPPKGASHIIYGGSQIILEKARNRQDSDWSDSVVTMVPFYAYRTYQSGGDFIMEIISRDGKAIRVADNCVLSNGDIFKISATSKTLTQIGRPAGGQY